MYSYEQKIDQYVNGLLHIDDKGNKLLDLGADSDTIIVYKGDPQRPVADQMLSIIRLKKGAVYATTMLKDSALSKDAPVLGEDLDVFDWQYYSNGVKDADKLEKFIASIYTELSYKGNNPLFLSVGAIRWTIRFGNNDPQDVVSPLLLVPVRLVRRGNLSNVAIDFVDEDIFLNPCVIAKMAQVYGQSVADGFPSVESDWKTPINIKDFPKNYFDRVREYMANCKRSSNATFELEKDLIAISQFSHEEMGLYYDIRRNKQAILDSNLVKAIFNKEKITAQPSRGGEVPFVLPTDSGQAQLIRSVVDGNSMIIKGPPGSGKTHTIINMVAALIGSGKKVLVSSEKLAALEEVYAKMPGELQKFALLLDCESESQAAKLAPASVKANLLEVLRSKKEGDDKHASAEYRTALQDRNVASAKISHFLNYMYGNNERVAGYTYYEALDAFCKNPNLPVIYDFANGEGIGEKWHKQTLLNSSVEDVLQVLNAVDIISKSYAGLIGDETNCHSARKCPWLPLGTGHSNEHILVDINGAMSLADSIAKYMSGALKNNADILSAKYGDRINGIVVQTLIDLVQQSENQGRLDVEKLLKVNDDNLRFLQGLLDTKRKTEKVKDKYKIDDYKQCKIALDRLYVDRLLSMSEIKIIYAHRDVIDILIHSFDEIKRQVDVYLTEGEHCKEQYNEFLKYFRDDLSEKEKGVLADERARRLLNESYKTEKDLSIFNPDLYTLKRVKKLLKKSDTNLVGIRKGLIAYFAYSAAKDAMDQAAQITGTLFERTTSLSDNEMIDIYKMIRIVSERNCDRSRVYRIAISEYGEIEKCFQGVHCSEGDDNCIIGEVDTMCQYLSCLKTIDDFLKLNNLGTDMSAECILAVTNLLKYFVGKNPVKEKIEEAKEFIADVRNLNVFAERMALESLADFANRYAKTYYTENLGSLTYADFRVFVKEAVSKEVFRAANEYISGIDHYSSKFDLIKFFYSVEEKYYAPNVLRDLMEHTIADMILSIGRAKSDQTTRMSLANSVTDALEKYLRADETIHTQNVNRIAENIYRDIEPRDEKYKFLDAEKSGIKKLRLLFKNHADAVLSLKRCFLLAPYSVSLFFRKREFFDFDVVIIDEASQLEPVSLLPVLCRAKQCVIVGDEWQMPPIKHFISSGAAGMEDMEDEYAEESALGIALTSETIDVVTLNCHYRSQTESLIAYSQGEFYKDMQTFPAACPYGENLGLHDVYVDNATVNGGENEAEAKAVIDWIQRMVDTYYDEQTESLTQSLGVIVFGQSQKELIESKLKKTKPLGSKIRAILDAAKGRKESPEKQFFIRTIEKAQGREADHIALSFTYGRTKTGTISNSFAELNKSKYGKCIFNVAITRAKSSLTVIHSIKSEEITSENIRFVADYLRLVEKLSKQDKSQFVGDDNMSKGFVRSVGDYLESQGIYKDRIVYNYGVTEGSVRIPIAVLSHDRSCAVLGIWCDSDFEHNKDCFDKYLDRNLYRFAALEKRDWKLMRLYAYDWVENSDILKGKLKKELDNL